MLLRRNEPYLRLVHLTDLHCGADIFKDSGHDPAACEYLLDHIEELSPSHVVVTGDLTDTGGLPEFLLARALSTGQKILVISTG